MWSLRSLRSSLIIYCFASDVLHCVRNGFIGSNSGGFGTELLRECLRDPRERHLTPEAFAKAFGRQQLPPRQGGPADEKMCVLDHICENHTADAKTAQRALELLGAHVTEQEARAKRRVGQERGKGYAAKGTCHTKGRSLIVACRGPL